MGFPRAMRLAEDGEDADCLVVSDPRLCGMDLWDFEAELIRFDGEIATPADRSAIVAKLHAEEWKSWTVTFTNPSTMTWPTIETGTWTLVSGNGSWTSTGTTFISTGSFVSPHTLTTTGTSGWSTSYLTCSLSVPQISSNWTIKSV